MKRKSDKVFELKQCDLCPRKCGINRSKGQLGFCGAGNKVEIAHWQIHLGEEPPLSAAGGAGTIFFAHCNFKCVYCQNYQISQEVGSRSEKTSFELSNIMLKLEKLGAQNIDLVSPTHYVLHIVEAVSLARGKGLTIPIVYNTNGYEAPQTLDLLQGTIDIYLPDFKYYDDVIAQKYSQVTGYPEVVKQAIKLMYEQAGDLVINSKNIAIKGMLLRHLVLPNDLAGSVDILEFLAATVGTGIGLSIMSQYHPCYRADRFQELNRTITAAEYDTVVNAANRLGFEKCWIQEFSSKETYLPDFDQEEVFKKQ